MVRELSPGTSALQRQPSGPPLIGLLQPLVEWWEERHLELMAEAGFDDVRRAHNQVFMHLPAEGRRLTGLADAAGMTKQAMGELVDDLVRKGYLAKEPDPSDGRAKLLVWAERGNAAHVATMEAFATLEAEVADLVGGADLARLRAILLRLVGSTHDLARDTGTDGDVGH